MKTSVLERIRSRTSPETSIYIKKNLDVSERVIHLLKEKGWTQKEFAKMLGKSEPEVSRWLSGLHNLTIKTIAKMEAALGAEILAVPKYHFEQTPANQPAILNEPPGGSYVKT